MMSLETRISGRLLGYAYIVNKGLVESEKNLYTYYVEYHRMDKKPSVLNFKIIHNQEEGVEKLSLLIYKKINEILEKKRD